jgi:serine kinase of HPr protein (carbohydrate metabolism regulator)
VPELVHGTAVAVAGRAVLLRGPSGAGKSDLALRLISTKDRLPGLTGTPLLVGDDYLHLSAERGRLILLAPPTIAGRIEVRGVGIIEVAHVPRATLALIVDLVAPAAVPRLPDAENIELLGCQVPRLALAAFEASAALKVLAALAATAPPAIRRKPPKALASRRDTRQT